MTWHRSPYLLSAVIAITVVVGWTLFLTGSFTGQSFGINAITTPSPRYGSFVRGFDYGILGHPFDTRSFLNAKRLCSPESSTMYSFPPNQHECCRRMCNDVCYAYNEQRPGPCLNPCINGCMSQMPYTLT